jgi:hypothetical protein
MKMTIAVCYSRTITARWKSTRNIPPKRQVHRMFG